VCVCILLFLIWPLRAHCCTACLSIQRKLYVRRNDSHQAFLLARKMEVQPVIYDGILHRGKSALEDQAIVAWAAIGEMSGSTSSSCCIPTVAQLPPQTDDWSCGHRIVLTVRHLLAVSCLRCRLYCVMVFCRATLC
jgi:hypothetical protein